MRFVPHRILRGLRVGWQLGVADAGPRCNRVAALVGRVHFRRADRDPPSGDSRHRWCNDRAGRRVRRDVTLGH